MAQFDDETVQAIMEEALKYEGWTYVYGGDSPSTSFDLSLIHICDGEKFPVLRKAIRAVTNSEERGLFKVIEELRAEGTTTVSYTHLSGKQK